MTPLPAWFLLLAFCCDGSLPLHLGSFVPSIFGGTGLGFGNQGGGGVLGFNPLGVVQNILSSIPGGRTALGAGPFVPNGFGGGGQPGFGTGQGFPGPQMPPLPGGFPSGMPSVPGIGTNQGPQMPPLSGGIPPGGPVFPGAGGGLGPHLPQPQPPLSQGPNVPPLLPGQGNVPVRPGGTDNVSPTPNPASCQGTGCDEGGDGGESIIDLIDPRSSKKGSSGGSSERA